MQRHKQTTKKTSTDHIGLDDSSKSTRSVASNRTRTVRFGSICYRSTPVVYVGPRCRVKKGNPLFPVLFRATNGRQQAADTNGQVPGNIILMEWPLLGSTLVFHSTSWSDSHGWTPTV
jgi:hypothetical protein